MIRLRPHHLFCIQGFQGYGYDQEFTRNFGSLARQVQERPDTAVMVTDGPDDVCGSCPNLNGTRCGNGPDSETKVRQHDRALLETLGLMPGAVTSIAEVMDSLSRDEARLQAVLRWCRSCRWTRFCGFAGRYAITEEGR